MRQCVLLAFVYSFPRLVGLAVSITSLWVNSWKVLDPKISSKSMSETTEICKTVLMPFEPNLPDLQTYSGMHIS